MSIGRYFAYCLAPLLLSSCYPLQQSLGQLDLRFNQVPLKEAAQLEKDPDLKKLLLETSSIKNFGESHLGLKPSQNYEGYYQTKYDGVTFVVVAAPKLEMKQKEWWFPIIGSVPYKGYFNPDDAKKLQKELEEEGFDTHIFKSAAYSTLGWFKDPLTTPQLKNGRYHLAQTLFHEMAHSTLYIKGQGKFNEQMASFIGKKAAEAYFKSQGEAGESFLKAHHEAKKNSVTKSKKHSLLLQRAKGDLSELYSSAKSDSELLVSKESILKKLQNDLSEIYPKADKKALLYNNARLLLAGLYQEENPLFQKLWKESKGDWSVFWDGLKAQAKSKNWEF